MVLSAEGKVNGKQGSSLGETQRRDKDKHIQGTKKYRIEKWKKQ
jgi:hypothetical protein